ncbi:hypothetical protein [Burkholderia singularis]|uniref:hypothetical protein n=1 Tax=Burkholderia singularis TaxID=1503053 RepID=UPI000B793F6A|nr:hypothetical protein [Burkholderia singularis]
MTEKSNIGKTLDGRRVAQCWYSAAEYSEIKSVMDDGHKLPARYEDWRAGAEQREDQVRRAGGTPVRIAFDLAEFRRFCAHFRAPLNADTRSKFAALKSQIDAEAGSDPGAGVH